MTKKKITTEKLCTRCNEVKSTDLFYKRGQYMRKDQFQSMCIECYKTRYSDTSKRKTRKEKSEAGRSVETRRRIQSQGNHPNAAFAPRTHDAATLTKLLNW